MKQKDLMNKKHKMVCTALNYIEHLKHVLVFAISECVSTSTFASLIGIPIGIVSSSIGFKICAMTVD